MSASIARARLANLADITRFTNSLYGALYTLLGAYLADGTAALGRSESWGAALVVAIVIAYGFVINDYRDVREDSFGKAHRPIPSGRISRDAALRLAWALAALALLVALPLGPTMLLFALGTTALATLYSFGLKGTVLLGNASMATLIAAIPLYGALASGAVPPVIWIVAGLMWLFDFSHEILKTTADWQADAAAGLHTVATVFGVEGALRIFQATALAVLAVAWLPWAVGQAPLIYLLALVPCAILPTLAVVVVLARNSSDATIARALRIMRYMWISNLLPIVLLGKKSGVRSQKCAKRLRSLI
ncbi:UbiA family prenyltransferase [Candidatus Gracilibacteria bacterium]|nr:UbiA family prenyltransferase [Candidatus Gracilibacteria bacterium]